jgi:tetratricopeptide (TPR) repeat protein
LYKRYFISLVVLALVVPLSAFDGTSVGAPSTPANEYAEAARLAASQYDFVDAARLYRESLAGEPNNASLLSKAYLYSAVSGDMDGAVGFARRVIAIEPNNRMARLGLVVADLKKADYHAARSDVSMAEKGPFTGLTLMLLDAWALEGLGDTNSALTDLKTTTTEGGTETLEDFQTASILDLAGRDSDADAAYRKAFSAGINPTVVDAYGRFLERAKRVADARALYAKLQSIATVTPITARGLTRLDAGEIPDRLIASPAQGAAESLLGIAASLTDPKAVSASILYLQFALFLSPHLDLAKIVLASRYEALQKLDLAVSVYRTVDAASPFRAAADAQIAVDESRRNENEKKR